MLVIPFISDVLLYGLLVSMGCGIQVNAVEHLSSILVMNYVFLQVLVMTAQILLNILRHSIIRMEAINLLILDECHHAVKKHPYSLVMSEFYHTTPKDKRPSVFGMTASPVNLKGFCLTCTIQ